MKKAAKVEKKAVAPKHRTIFQAKGAGYVLVIGKKVFDFELGKTAYLSFGLV